MAASQALVDRTFAALAEPTRRAVIERLRQRPHRAGELAEALAISPPALSRHLRVLRGSELIEETGDETDARVRIFRLRREPFERLRRWVLEVEELWTEQLTAFAEHVERTRGKGRGRR